MFKKLLNFYYKNYKKIMFVPLILLVISLIIIGNTWMSEGSIIYMDSSLEGGVTFTLTYEKDINTNDLENYLKNNLDTSDVKVMQLYDNLGAKIIGYQVQASETITREEIKNNLEQYIDMSIEESMISFGRQSSSIGTSFISLGTKLLFLGFLFTALVTFYYFKNIIPSLSITFSTISDVIGIIAFLDLFEIKFSVATIGALLMIIGYSTDSDIVLATNILKRRDDSLKNRIKRAIKTELTMDSAAVVTYSLMYIFSTVYIIKHIAFILLLGVFFDIINTWLGNAVFQRIYLEKVVKK